VHRTGSSLSPEGRTLEVTDRLHRTPFTGIAGWSRGQYFRPAASLSVPSRQSAWCHISDRRRPPFSGHNTWSHTPGKRASTRGLMCSYLQVPRLTYAARPPGGGTSQKAISPPPAAAFRGDVAAQSREVTHTWSAGGRAPDFRTSPTPAGSSAGKMRTARAKPTPIPMNRRPAHLALCIVLGQLDRDSGTGHYRRLLTGRVCWGTPIRHAAVLLQREQIRSPAHSLWNVPWHLRHWRTLGTSLGGCSLGASVAGK